MVPEILSARALSVSQPVESQRPTQRMVVLPRGVVGVRSHSQYPEGTIRICASASVLDFTRPYGVPNRPFIGLEVEPTSVEVCFIQQDKGSPTRMRRPSPNGA